MQRLSSQIGARPTGEIENPDMRYRGETRFETLKQLTISRRVIRGLSQREPISREAAQRSAFPDFARDARDNLGRVLPTRQGLPSVP